jgi:hypothetical protein
MRSRFPGFATVRVVCAQCGWYRILGHTGSNGTVRAFIRLASDPAPCNVVWSKVIEVPTGGVPETSVVRGRGYRDLAEEWHWRRPDMEVSAAIRSYKPLVQGRACPRCKRIGGVRLDVLFDNEMGTGGFLVMCEPDAEPPRPPEPPVGRE